MWKVKNLPSILNLFNQNLMKPLLSADITGNWATLLLATDTHGNIDFIKLSDEIDVLIASRPDGIYSNGTAGEFYAQTDGECLEISEMLAMKCEKAGIPFQIGVSHMSPQVSLQRLKLVRQLLPGAVQVILPDWFPTDLTESAVFLDKMAEEAGDISLVLYNPPHAKRTLMPEDWMVLKSQIPSLMGVKVFDQGGDPEWYAQVRKSINALSVFIPGHRMATGIKSGMHGAYSNMACLNPFAAQKWYNLTKSNLPAALELENRINLFMKACIQPLIERHHYSNPACDRFMAIVGGWADVGHILRWPYKSVPVELVEPVQHQVKQFIPEFLEK